MQGVAVIPEQQVRFLDSAPLPVQSLKLLAKVEGLNIGLHSDAIGRRNCLLKPAYQALQQVMHTRAVQLPEMRRISTFEQISGNDIAQLRTERDIGALIFHNIKPSGASVEKIRVIALRDRCEFDAPMDKLVFEHVGQIARYHEHWMDVIHDQRVPQNLIVDPLDNFPLCLQRLLVANQQPNGIEERIVVLPENFQERIAEKSLSTT